MSSHTTDAAYKSIYVIGPTSSGKSDLAIALAKKYNGEIISCDSRQIYRHMDIGSGKESGKIKVLPSRPPATRKPYISGTVAHYLIDSHSPHTDFSAGKFVALALRIQRDIVTRGKVPIICGGTMFWAQALLEKNAVAPVKPNKQLRAKLAGYSKEKLFQLLKKADPLRAKVLRDRNELNNKVRLIRSLEIISCESAVSQQPKPDYAQLNKDNLILNVSRTRTVLRERICKRLTQRLAAGMLDEVYDLHHIYGVAWSRLIRFGLEYQWCTQLLRGEITTREFEEGLQNKSWQYARRQLTWIRRWKKAGARIHDVATLSQASKLVDNFFK